LPRIIEGQTFFATRELAPIMGVAQRTIRDWIICSLIPAIRHSESPKSPLLVSAEDALSFIDSGVRRTPPKAKLTIVSLMRVGELPKATLFEYITQQE